jgi:dihydropteroate synthase
VFLERWPCVIGIVNVTPDSFSDGGRYLAADAAVDHGLALAGAGAAAVDVGGESTRPGARPVEAAEERRRVVPVVERLVAALPGHVAVSVDTRSAAVAEAAVGAGARIVNDVSAGTHDPAILGVVARHDVEYVAMHMRGTPETMQDDPRYEDVVAEVAAYLRARVRAAAEAGVDPARIAVDPGIGFGKTADHNWALLARLPELVAAVEGRPVVVGTSRKGFLGRVLAAPDGTPQPVGEREEATLATVVWALDQGASAVRVHDVRTAVRAASVLDIMVRAYDGGLVEGGRPGDGGVGGVSAGYGRVMEVGR